MRTLTAIFLLLCCAAALMAGIGDGQWLARVPAKDADRKNPLAQQPNAAAAGENLFRQHCAWLLTNGSLKNGMPSWSRLPDQQRWALVTYVKTLDPK